MPVACLMLLARSRMSLFVNCFKSTGVEEVCVPDCVHWLCDRYLKGCLSLRCVTFGPSS